MNAKRASRIPQIQRKTFRPISQLPSDSRFGCSREALKIALGKDEACSPARVVGWPGFSSGEMPVAGTRAYGRFSTGPIKLPS